MDEWATHQQALVHAVMRTNGSVLEMGCGNYSTPILHEICTLQKRRLISVDNNKEWSDIFISFANEYHEIRFIESWDALDGEYDVVFIDHAPAERRKVDIERFKDKCKIMVIHDYLQDHIYHHHDIINTFKYKKVFNFYNRQTVIVSNIIEL